MRELCRAVWGRVRVWWRRRRGEMKVSGKDWRERGIAGVIEVLLAVNNLGGVWKKLRHIAMRTKFRVIRLTINLLLAINATIQITRKAWLSSGSWIKSILIRSIISILLLVNRTIQWITLKTISANAICTSLNQKIYNNGRPYVLAGVIYFLMTIQAVIKFFQKFTPEEPRITRPLSIVESSFPTSTGSIGAASPRSMTSAFFTSTTNILASSASSIKEMVMRPRMLLPMYKDTDSGGRKHTNSTYNMWMVFITSQRLEKLVAPEEGAGTRGGTVGGVPRAGALV
ncbi:hypothetical protein FPQ18DRAFT_390620 [Pyronema domesticum]|nr:hypothetical protein FPQ18DRAFT_390620 [Pyronema domesticum]